MNLHEYQAKELFRDYGLPVSEGIAVDTAEEAVSASKKIGGTQNNEAFARYDCWNYSSVEKWRGTKI